MTLAARVLVALVRGYQRVLSPLLPPRCRFAPTCSAYAVVAVRRHGAGRGSWLAVRRVLRCHPFDPGGHDPVPPARWTVRDDAVGRDTGTGTPRPDPYERRRRTIRVHVPSARRPGATRA